ncbi:hypothetical protein [Enterobacter cloacae]|uniref:hypothetical protein n=1 Tax=Enterobacter cloacae TaxID=550 RepID=UPI00325A6302
MAEDSKLGGSRAVGIAGGGGVGMFLTQLAPLIVDETKRNIYIAAIPFFALILGEIFTFLTKLVSLDAEKIRVRIRLKFLKFKLWRGKNDQSVSQELRDLAEKRYNIIKGIEMGVYDIDTYFQQAAVPTPSVAPVQPVAASTPGVAPVQPVAASTPGVAPVQPVAASTPGVAPVQPVAASTPSVAPVLPVAASNPGVAPPQTVTAAAPAMSISPSQSEPPPSTQETN